MWTVGSILCGHVIFVLGVQTRSVVLLVIGRIGLGLGGEIAAVATGGVISAWFQ